MRASTAPQSELKTQRWSDLQVLKGDRFRLPVFRLQVYPRKAGSSSGFSSSGFSSVRLSRHRAFVCEIRLPSAGFLVCSRTCHPLRAYRPLLQFFAGRILPSFQDRGLCIRSLFCWRSFSAFPFPFLLLRDVAPLLLALFAAPRLSLFASYDRSRRVLETLEVGHQHFSEGKQRKILGQFFGVHRDHVSTNRFSEIIRRIVHCQDGVVIKDLCPDGEGFLVQLNCLIQFTVCICLLGFIDEPTCADGSFFLLCLRQRFPVSVN